MVRVSGKLLLIIALAPAWLHAEPKPPAGKRCDDAQSAARGSLAAAVAVQNTLPRECKNAISTAANECATRDHAGGFMAPPKVEGGIGSARAGLARGMASTINELRIAARVCLRASSSVAVCIPPAGPPIPPPPATTPPPAATPAPEPSEAAKVALKTLADDLKALYQCRANYADDVLKDGRKMLESEGADANGVTKGEIICTESNVSNVELCRYSEDPPPTAFIHDEEGERGLSVLENNPVRILGPDSMCSGSRLGDSRTVVTAGHCVPEGGNFDADIVDAHGNQHRVQLSCSRGAYGGGVDTGMCTIVGDPPPPARPLYFATVDSTLTSGCVDMGWVRRCARSTLETAMSGSPVRLEGYPGGDQQLGKEGTYISRGRVEAWFPGDSRLRPIVGHNATTVNGMSGSALVTMIEGKPTIIGVHRIGHGGYFGDYNLGVAGTLTTGEMSYFMIRHNVIQPAVTSNRLIEEYFNWITGR